MSWRGGLVHAKLDLARGDASPFVSDPDATWKHDSLFVASTERVMVGTPAEVIIVLEGRVTQLHGTGRVVGVSTVARVGFRRQAS